MNAPGKWIFVSSLFLGPCNLLGQSYVTAMGMRMGSDIGVSIQQRIISRFTMEGIVSSNMVRSETTGTIVVQIHKPLISKRFNFYLGGGFHNRWRSLPDGHDLTLRGITAIAGAEMTLGRINLSWDYKPVYHLNAEESPFESETAVTMRYVFIKKIGRRAKRRGLFQPNQQKQKERRKRKKVRLREKKQLHRTKARTKRKSA